MEGQSPLIEFRCLLRSRNSISLGASHWWHPPDILVDRARKNIRSKLRGITMLEMESLSLQTYEPLFVRFYGLLLSQISRLNDCQFTGSVADCESDRIKGNATDEERIDRPSYQVRLRHP